MLIGIPGAAPIRSGERALGEQAQRRYVERVLVKGPARQLGALVGATERTERELGQAGQQGRSFVRRCAREAPTEQFSHFGPVRHRGRHLEAHAGEVQIIGQQAQCLVQHRRCVLRASQFAPEQAPRTPCQEYPGLGTPRPFQAVGEEYDDGVEVARSKKQVLGGLVDIDALGVQIPSPLEKSDGFGVAMKLLADNRQAAQERSGGFVVPFRLVDRLQPLIVGPRLSRTSDLEEQIAQAAQRFRVSRHAADGLLVGLARVFGPREAGAEQAAQLQVELTRRFCIGLEGGPSTQQSRQLCVPLALAIDVREPFQRGQTDRIAAERERPCFSGLIGPIELVAQKIGALGIQRRQLGGRLDDAGQPQQRLRRRRGIAPLALEVDHPPQIVRAGRLQARRLGQKHCRARGVRDRVAQHGRQTRKPGGPHDGVGGPLGRHLEHASQIVEPTQSREQRLEAGERLLDLSRAAVQGFLIVADGLRCVAERLRVEVSEPKVSLHSVRRFDPFAARRLVAKAQELFEVGARAPGIAFRCGRLRKPQERRRMRGFE